MAISNCEVINFANIASDCQVAVSTVRGYMQILEDTMLGTMLQPWRGSKKRKATATAKFYFFDTGVARVLSETKSIARHSNLYGKSFEQFIWMELRAYLSYTEKDHEITFWRSQNKHEVDFLLGEEIAIEVKATKNITNRDLKGLKALAEENIFQKFYLVSHDKLDRKHGSIHLLFWKTFIENLWAGKLV